MTCVILIRHTRRMYLLGFRILVPLTNTNGSAIEHTHRPSSTTPTLTQPKAQHRPLEPGQLRRWSSAISVDNPSVARRSLRRALALVIYTPRAHTPAHAHALSEPTTAATGPARRRQWRGQISLTTLIQAIHRPYSGDYASLSRGVSAQYTSMLSSSTCAPSTPVCQARARLGEPDSI